MAAMPDASDRGVVLDHLVVAATSLASGVDWCERTLGVTPGPGGSHALFGTHNRLLKIATTAWPDAYLEIIAIDPQAPPPARRRWFGLDDPVQQQRWATTPQLVHWVARSATLDAHRQALLALGLDPGVPVQAGRDTPLGPLAWRLLVRDDGTPPGAGVLPTLIEWQGRHPAGGMPDSGVRLQAVHLQAVDSRAAAVLRPAAVALEPAAVPGLRAVLQTPRGAVVLQSPP
jgi:hypothetical protein